MKRFWAVTLALTAAFLMIICVFLVPQAAATTSSAEGTWDQMASMPTARDSMGVGVVDGKIYVIGGEAYNLVAANEEYNPETNTWTTKSSMPTARSMFGTSVVDDKIYCIGGSSIDGGGAPLATNQAYDPKTDTWATVASMPTGRWGCVASAVNSKIYVIGGYPYTGIMGTIACNVTEMYDPETDTWATIAPVPEDIRGCVSVVVDDKIYLFVTSGNTDGTILIYDPQTNTWTTGAALPMIAYGSGGATTGVYAPKRIYLFGSNQAIIYDPQTDTYTGSQSMPTSRIDLSVAVVDDRLYAIGGETSNGLPGYYATNERYTPANYCVPPSGQVLSPQNNTTYNSSSVPLQFTVTGQAASFCYSLDCGGNVSVAGNTTLDGLTGGIHNVTVYALDEQNNSFAIQTVAFAVNLDDTDQTENANLEMTAVIAGTITAATIIAAASLLMLYRKKHQKPAQTTQV